MDRNLYKLTKILDDIIVMLILQCHQNVTAKTVGSTDFHQT